MADIKPYVTSVLAKSLSIVLGTPITLTPFLEKSLALVRVPSPPKITKTSTPSFSSFQQPHQKHLSLLFHHDHHLLNNQINYLY